MRKEQVDDAIAEIINNPILGIEAGILLLMQAKMELKGASFEEAKLDVENSVKGMVEK